MDWRRECAAVIPCFNEAAQIHRVVSAVQNHLPAVIVLDDGSTDRTAEKARFAGAQIVRLDRNSGKGSALRAGWRRAHDLGFKWALMLDGDGQHAAADIPKFFACASSTGASLVVGNRMNQLEDMPFIRRWANRWMSRRISRLTAHELPDSQCGFRLARLDLLLELPIQSNRFEIESEMLLAFFAAGQKVEFVPVQTIYQSGASKINPLTDTLRWLRWSRLSARPCGPAAQSASRNTARLSGWEFPPAPPVPAIRDGESPA
jgi:glycosyltransferase involved in cell wall biosynthesis